MEFRGLFLQPNNYNLLFLDLRLENVRPVGFIAFKREEIEDPLVLLARATLSNALDATSISDSSKLLSVEDPEECIRESMSVSERSCWDRGSYAARRWVSGRRKDMIPSSSCRPTARS